MALPTELYLKIGMEVNAKVMPDPHTYTVGVRGWKANQYILLDHPVAGMNLARIAPDAQCTLRYVSEGRVTSFAVRGVTVLKNPLNIYVIEYPKTVHSQISLRKQERIKTTIPVSLEEADSKEEARISLRGAVLDISLGGVLLASHREFPVDKALSLSFEFITGQRVEKIQAKVKNKSIDARQFDLPYLHGCEFTGIQPEERKIFQNFFEFCFKQRDQIRIKERAMAPEKTTDLHR